MVGAFFAEAAAGLAEQKKKFDPREIAMIYNDMNGLYLKTAESISSQWNRDPGAEAVKVLAGRQILTFDLWLDAPAPPGYRRIVQLKEPLNVTETIVSGHRYQVVTVRTKDSDIVGVQLVDITTQDDIWKLYEAGIHQEKAVKFLTRVDRLKEVAMNNPAPYIRRKAIAKLSDEAFLIKMESEETNEYVLDAIKERLAKIRK
jgi:hypothetical protein